MGKVTIKNPMPLTPGSTHTDEQLRKQRFLFYVMSSLYIVVLVMVLVVTFYKVLG